MLPHKTVFIPFKPLRHKFKNSPIVLYSNCDNCFRVSDFHWHKSECYSVFLHCLHYYLAFWSLCKAILMNLLQPWYSTEANSRAHPVVCTANLTIVKLHLIVLDANFTGSQGFASSKYKPPPLPSWAKNGICFTEQISLCWSSLSIIRQCWGCWLDKSEKNISEFSQKAEPTF